MTEATVTGIDLTLRVNTQPKITIHRSNAIQETRPIDLGELSDVITNHTRQSIFTPPEMIATNVVEWSAFWRPPMIQQVLIGVDGSKDATTVMIPLPGLVCKYFAEGRMSIAAFRGKTRPGLGDELFLAPLPNVTSHDGGVCMGNTSKPFQGKRANAIDPDLMWTTFFASAFTSHGAKGQCKSYPEDVRLLLYKLDGEQTFPLKELLPMKSTLEQWL